MCGFLYVGVRFLVFYFAMQLTGSWFLNQATDVKVPSPNHWTAKEFPGWFCLVVFNVYNNTLE